MELIGQVEPVLPVVQKKPIEQSKQATLAEKFEVLIRTCDELTLAPYQRERLQNQLGYFKIQATMEPARRDSDRARSMNWRKLLLDRKSESLLAKFRADLQFWSALGSFVGETLGDDDSQPMARAKSNMSDQRPRAALRLEDFFAQLFREAERAIPSAQRSNKLLLGVSLQYLKLECRQKPEDRNAKFLRHTWQSIWPLLNGFHLLDPYKEDFALKAKLQAFIANSFVAEPAEPKTQRVSTFDRVSTKTAARPKPFLVAKAPVSRPKPRA